MQLAGNCGNDLELFVRHTGHFGNRHRILVAEFKAGDIGVRL